MNKTRQVRLTFSKTINFRNSSEKWKSKFFWNSTLDKLSNGTTVGRNNKIICENVTDCWNCWLLALVAKISKGSGSSNPQFGQTNLRGCSIKITVEQWFASLIDKIGCRKNLMQLLLSSVCTHCSRDMSICSSCLYCNPPHTRLHYGVFGRFSHSY